MLSDCPLKWLCQFTFWYYEAWKLLPVWVLIPFLWLEIGHLFVLLLAIYNFLSVNCLFTFAHFSSEFFSFWFIAPFICCRYTSCFIYYKCFLVVCYPFVSHFFFFISSNLNFFSDFFSFGNKVLDYESNINSVENLGSLQKSIKKKPP